MDDNKKFWKTVLEILRYIITALLGFLGGASL